MKVSIFCIAMLLTLFPATAIAAENIEYRYAGMDKKITYLGESNTYYFDITNNMNENKTIMLLPNPIYHQWFLTGTSKNIEIEPKGTKKTEVTVSPPSDTTTGTYTIVFQQCVKGEPICSRNIRIPVYVIDRNQLIFETMKTVKSDYFDNEDVEIFFRLNNTKFSMVQNYSYRINIYDSEKKIIKTITNKLPPIDRNDLYAETVNLEKIGRGTKTVEMILLDENNEILQKKSAGFGVKEYIEVIIPKEPSINIEEKPGLFVKTITVTIRNKNYFDYTATYSDQVTHLKRYLTQPAKKMGNTYTFECNLKPFGEDGDTCIITYQINYWKAYIVIISFIAILITVYFNLTKPIIIKRVYKKHGYHNIHINIINRSPKKLYNVKVTDRIPITAKATGHFSLKPKSEQTIKNEKEIKWDLGVLKAGEQRLISYTIKSRFEIKGGVKLSTAILKAEDKNKKAVKITSNKPVI